VHWFLGLAVRIFRMIPLSWALFLGRCLGGLFYLRTRRRNIALTTIKQAFPQKTFRESYALARTAFFNLGQSLAETILLDKMKARVKFSFETDTGTEGQIISGIHQGSWELYNAAFSDIHPLAILVKPQKNGILNDFLEHQRRKPGLFVCRSLKDLFRFMGRGCWSGIMVDHGAETKAVYASFFGHEIPCPGGAVRIAKKLNKKIYPAFGFRRGADHFVHIAAPFDSQGATEEELISALNSYYEQMISLYPKDYLWSFGRFKRKKDRSVLVLSDGKPGHLKQSLSLVSVLKQSGYDIRVREEKIVVKDRKRRVLNDLAAVLSRFSLCRGDLFLRLLLPAEVYSSLTRDFFDIVISTGSSMAPLNVLLSRLNKARSCHIMKPNLPLSFFDLTLLPEHDRCRAFNTLTVKGALASGDEHTVLAEEGRDFFKLSPRKKIALFVGGSQCDRDIFLKNLDLFLKELKQFSLKNDYQLLVSTSRRTSAEAEEIIVRALKGFANQEALVLVSRKNYPFVVPAFLASSDMVFVTAESVSMISESAALAKTTLAVFLEKIVKPQHRRFLDSLKDGFVNFHTFPYNKFSVKRPQRSLAEENGAVLKEAAKRLI